MAGGDAWDYTYDLQGNLVREAGPEGERQYLYDTENRQIRVLSGGKEIQEDRYDGEGMRAGLTVNGKKSTFLYADQRLYAEFDETGADVSRYIWGDGLVGLGCQGQLYGVHRDEQLSTRWITGGEGGLENAYEYDAFGVLLGSHGKVPGRLLYGGQQYDAETEQYYLRARYYDPSGRNGNCNGNSNAKNNAQRENTLFEEKRFPENYPGMKMKVQPDGKVIFEVEAGGYIYKVEYHPNHGSSDHYDENHYHVKKQSNVPPPGKTKTVDFRIPNLDPNSPTTSEGGTFAPGDLLPTKNNKGGKK